MQQQNISSISMARFPIRSYMPWLQNFMIIHSIEYANRGVMINYMLPIESCRCTCDSWTKLNFLIAILRMQHVFARERKQPQVTGGESREITRNLDARAMSGTRGKRDRSMRTRRGWRLTSAAPLCARRTHITVCDSRAKLDWYFSAVREKLMHAVDV